MTESKTQRSGIKQDNFLVRSYVKEGKGRTEKELEMSDELPGEADREKR